MKTLVESRLIEGIDYFKVADGVWGMKDIFVNIYMIENPADKTWVLVDAGLKTTGTKIKMMAREIFADNPVPSCIILTHAHFDHVGSLQELASQWNVPVYAHYLELPYLTRQSEYAPPDPSVGGGMMARMSFVFPEKPVDMSGKVTALPSIDELPFLWGWRYIHTPGHAPGHISLFRGKDKILISGDALVTTNMQSFWSVLFQTKTLSGPPKYFTYDWEQAQASVNKLWMLEPEVIAGGHGKPMKGHDMRKDFNELEHNFQEDYVPKKGRYVDRPAVANASGFLYVPKKKFPLKTVIAAVGVSTAAFLIAKNSRKKGKS